MALVALPPQSHPLVTPHPTASYLSSGMPTDGLAWEEVTPFKELSSFYNSRSTATHTHTHAYANTTANGAGKGKGKGKSNKRTGGGGRRSGGRGGRDYIAWPASPTLSEGHGKGRCTVRPAVVHHFAGSLSSFSLCLSITLH